MTSSVPPVQIHTGGGGFPVRVLKCTIQSMVPHVLLIRILVFLNLNIGMPQLVS
jgi:hypothetical protein